MDRFLRAIRLPERTVTLLIFGLYLAITLWTVVHHEAWSDETDPWLLMRDGGLRPLLEQTAYSYRGTPILWFLAIWPFAAGGASFLAQQLVNLGFAAGATFLFLRAAPFPIWIRALFVFSYFPAFEYAVIGRPYALLMLLMLSFAALWKERRSRPVPIALVVALMANTTAHGLVVGAAAGCALAIDWLQARGEKWRSQVGASVLMLTGGGLALLQLWPKRGGQVFIPPVELGTLHYSVAAAFFPEWRAETFFIPALLIFGVLLWGVSRRALPLLFLLLSLVPLLLIFLFVWMGGVRHAGIVLLLLVVALWMVRSEGPLRAEKLAMAALGFSLAVATIATFSAAITETRQAFSGSREVAEFIRESGLDGREIAAHPPLQCEPVLVYLPGKQFWYPARGADGSFVEWDRRFQLEQAIPLPEAIAAADRKLGKEGWLFLTNRELPESARPGFRLLFRSRQPIWAKWDESYYLYERPARSAGR